MKSPNMNLERVVLSGGGTGGHIYPAIAIANELKSRFPDAEFLFVGAMDRMEMEKVPQAGYKIEGLWISGIQRKLSLKNLVFPFKLIISLLRARKIIKSFKPNIIFNALHGQYGEDGYIQSILESQKIPYTHSGILASSIAMDKELSKKIFIKNKILTPKYIKFDFLRPIKNITKEIDKKLKFPVVIKPINEGSSVHVYICTKKNFIKKKFLKYTKKINKNIIRCYICKELNEIKKELGDVLLHIVF